MEIDDSSQIVKVVEPIENSPAIQSGIQAGDKILAIDGQSTLGMSLDKASALIRGEVGTPITLKLSREGKGVFEVTLKRAQIELPTVRYSLKQEGKMRVGYIHLEEFSSHAASQMSQAIKSLTNQKVDAFVLDLRGNPGGLLYASVEIAQMWFDRGAIVRTVDRQGSNEEFKANRSALTKLPLAVLVDKNSASASEILTGALKDNGRATVIGTQTFGKALVQSVHSLSDGSGLAVTVAHYYTPNGTDISHKGISPDVLVELTAEQRQQLAANSELIGTPADPQYAKAIATLANSRLAQTGNSQNAPNLVVPTVSNR
jgi:carboxyl-terminal processing protease